jgi:outer membrane receptor for monomeric catechols
MASQWNDFRVDGYERVDLNLSYKGLPDWDFSLNVRNLFDKKYFERVRYTPGNGYFYGSPLSALFKATYHFD